jgi:DNA repair protein RecO (recombination protein O)
MPAPRNYQTEAIIIKKTKLGEADRILTLFTPHLGKIQAVAKGVRRPRSKMAGHLELLTHSLVSLARGRNLETVTGSQTINSFLPLKSDLWLTACALYLTELVNQFTLDDTENYVLFQLLLSTMQNLCLPCNRELTLRYFEMRLLEAVGYQPQLHQCVACHKPLEPLPNTFSPGAGGMLCPTCSPGEYLVYTLSVNAQKVLRLLQSGDYETVNRLKTDAALTNEVERVLGGYIRYLLEREVKSAAWLDSLREEIVARHPASG